MFCAWMAFLFDFFTILVCVFFCFFVTELFLVGLRRQWFKTRYGRKIRTEEKVCSVARASLYLKLLLTDSLFPKYTDTFNPGKRDDSEGLDFGDAEKKKQNKEEEKECKIECTDERSVK